MSANDVFANAYEPSAEGLYALAAAVLWRAVQDARNGDRDALRWLNQDPWMESLCDGIGIEPSALRERLCRLS